MVMQIADHYTLAKLQHQKKRVVGLLFGRQEDQAVTIYEAAELYDTTAEAITNFERYDLPNFRKIFEEYECVGWYTTGESVGEDFAEFHGLLTKDIDSATEEEWRCERPLALCLHPEPPEESTELPIYTFERVLVKTGEGEGREAKFAPCPCALVSDEAERVTVVHCARTVTGDESTASALARPYQSSAKALGNLNDRLRIIIAFLSEVEEGKIKPEQRVLRQVKALCNRLPTMDSPLFRGDFYSEYNDALLLTLVAAMTKTQVELAALVQKSNTAGPDLRKVYLPQSLQGGYDFEDRPGGGPGMRGGHYTKIRAGRQRLAGGRARRGPQ